MRLASVRLVTLFVHCNAWNANGACERRDEREARRKAAGIN